MKMTRYRCLVMSLFFTNFAIAQTLQDGINYIDSDKFALAKENFTTMVSKEPNAANYFYLGNTYLKQGEPDFAKAAENFNKGLALDPKSFLNKMVRLLSKTHKNIASIYCT